jgi:hypothetical protein
VNIEAGKYYKTRAGRKAYVSSTDTPFARGSDSVLGSIEGIGCSWWDTCGRWGGAEHSHDLVAEWVDPATEERVVWLVRRDDGSTFTQTRSDSEGPPTHRKPIGSTRVTVTEGVFA